MTPAEARFVHQDWRLRGEQEGDGDQAIHEPRNLLRKMVEGKRICNFVSIADDGETLDPAEVFRVPCQKTRAVAAGGWSDPDVVV